jgi:hypothetical protein
VLQIAICSNGVSDSFLLAIVALAVFESLTLRGKAKHGQLTYYNILFSFLSCLSKAKFPLVEIDR